jgi:hypothetical protein
MTGYVFQNPNLLIIFWIIPINIGTTGRRKEELTLQQQQQMAMMGQTIDIHKVHVHKGHRKKFVHGSWTVPMGRMAAVHGSDTS